MSNLRKWEYIFDNIGNKREDGEDEGVDRKDEGRNQSQQKYGIGNKEELELNTTMQNKDYEGSQFLCLVWR